MTKQKWRTRGGDSSATVDIPSYYGWQIEEVCRDEVVSSSPHQSMNASLSTCLFACQPGPIAGKFSSLPLRLKKVIIRRQLFWILLRSHHLHSKSTHTYPQISVCAQLYLWNSNYAERSVGLRPFNKITNDFYNAI